jgi:hypothetical protein
VRLRCTSSYSDAITVPRRRTLQAYSVDAGMPLLCFHKCNHLIFFQWAKQYQDKAAASEPSS